MKKIKIFIACDTTNLTKAKRIINQTKTNKIKIGYKFGLEFMNSKNGRRFISSLKNKGIDFEQQTAGDFKRTVTMFGKNTEKDRKKLKEQLEDIHVLFKNFIKDNRKILDVEKVATGEYWYGKDALDLKLIDKILTSDEHVISMKESFDIIHVKYMPPKSLSDKLSKFSSRFSSNLLQKFEQKNYDDHLFK